MRANLNVTLLLPYTAWIIKKYFVHELYSSKYQNQMSNYWIFFKNAQMASSDWTAAGRVHFRYMAISVFKHVHAKRCCVISWMGAKTASIIFKQVQWKSNVVQLLICGFFSQIPICWFEHLLSMLKYQTFYKQLPNELLILF